MATPHSAGGKTLGLGEIHVILTNNIHHGITHVPDQDCSRHQRLRKRRQNEALQFRENIRGIPTARRQPMQLYRKQKHQQQTNPKRRHSNGDKRGNTNDMVRWLILLNAGNITQGQCKQQPQRSREQRQHNGNRQTFSNHLRDWSGKLHRGSQIQRNEILQINPVLFPQRLIQAELHAHGFHSIGTRLFTRHDAGRIAGDQVDHQECDDGNHQQHRQHLQEPL